MLSLLTESGGSICGLINKPSKDYYGIIIKMSKSNINIIVQSVPTGGSIPKNF